MGTEGRRVYVGGLPYGVDGRELRELCDKYGPIEDAFIVLEKFTAEKRSKGYGFVTFEDRADASDCIHALDGSDYDGRRLTVQEARPNNNARSGRRDDRRGDYGGRRDDERRGGRYRGGDRGYGRRGEYGGGRRRRDSYDERDRH